MEKQDIERYLAELEQELSNLGIQQPVRILIIGGTFMLEQVGNRSITEDIDVFFKDIQDRRNSPLYHNTSCPKHGGIQRERINHRCASA